MSYTALDHQLHRFTNQLITDVGLKSDEVSKVATLVASEVRFLAPQDRAKIFKASPVALRNRVEELVAFQAWMDLSRGANRNPVVVRAQVIIQNYVCFVYLSEACFRVLRTISPATSVTRRCCKFLTDNPVRAFRNAIAHSNWTYRTDFGGLIYWAKKGAGPDEAMTRFQVTQAELDFWQMLSRCVAYAAYTELQSLAPKI